MLIRRLTVVGDELIHSRETHPAAGLSERSLVLVHGVGTTSRYFRPLLRALDGRVSAAAIELPGIGSSTHRCIPDDIGSQADVVAGWLRATGRHPAVLVGNSMGAQTVVEVALRHPELVERLVLMGPTVDAEARSLLRQVRRLLIDATRERPSLLAIIASDTFLTKRSAVWRYMRASLQHPIEDRLHLLGVPVLIIRGASDPVAPRRWVEQLAAAAPDARIATIPNAAHACHHGRPDAVAQVLDLWHGPAAPT